MINHDNENMFSRFIDRLANVTFAAGKKRIGLYAATFVFLVAPVLIVASVSYLVLRKDLTTLTLSRRESLAYLASVVLTEKFDRLSDLGVSLASRVQFRNLIKEGKWNEAKNIIATVPQQFPTIERVALISPDGTAQALAPDFPGIVGTNFSQRDWYKGVTKDWKPYVSEIFKGATNQNNLAVAVPIIAEDGTKLGILVLQVVTDTLIEWSREVDVGSDGYVYLVDKHGHVAGHPRYPAQAEIIDFSSVPIVQKVLAGSAGVETAYNPVDKETRLSAYRPLPKYGWGVVVTQPIDAAFRLYNRSVAILLAIYGVIVLLNGALAYVILRTLHTVSEYRQRQEIFLESIGDGLFAIDRYWNITLWNRTAAELTGWSAKEVIGKPFRSVVKFVSEEDGSENIAFIEHAMLMGKRAQMEKHTNLVKRDGSKISVGDSASPIFNTRGVVTGAVVVFRDISKEHELEETRQEFASLSAHELRTPLTAIAGHVSMLLGDTSAPASYKESLLEIQEAAKRMSRLVNAMLNVYRIELGQLAIEPVPSDLKELATAAVKTLAPQMQIKKLTLREQYAPSLPLVPVDPDLMRAIFDNLLSNAIKYTPPGGTVTVTITTDNQAIYVGVADTGYGIPAAQQDKIFTKMFRADNIREKVTEGTGLGLYIVKSILDQAGGKIWFKSQENKGTTFYVSIPLGGMKAKAGQKKLS